jgi:hypothetical protein
MYKISRHHRTGRGRLTKENKVSHLQRHIALGVREMGLEDCCSGFYAYVSTTGFLAPENYWILQDGKSLRMKDLTNLWKPVEDALTRGLKNEGLHGLGIDDSRAIRQTQFKDFLPADHSGLKIFFSADLYELA